LDSIINQVTAPEEVIVIDDGSTDGTSTILQNYTKYPHFKIISTKNNGVGDARNLGRILSSSHYIYYFDSDDILENDFVEQIKSHIKNNDFPDIVLFNGCTFKDKDYQGSYNPTYSRNLTGLFNRDDELLTQLRSVRGDYSSACLYLSKAELWSTHKISFPSTIHEDEAVFYPLLAASQKSLVVPNRYFNRRVRHGSIMTSSSDLQKLEGYKRIFFETISFSQREPELIAYDTKAWRNRIKRFGLGYVNLALRIGVSVSWSSVIVSILIVKDPKYFVRLLYIPFKQRARKIFTEAYIIKHPQLFK
jgi:glycosyltransferase involved in cell wall biosynthesis